MPAMKVQLLLVACTVAAWLPLCIAMTWHVCEEAGDDLPMKPETIELSPDPPVIGSPATFTISGQAGVAATGGTVEIAVSLGGVLIYDTSEDLCSKTTCPMAAGPVALTIVEDLPPIAPPGQYGLRVVVRDSEQAQLLCVDVDFELVPPSLKAGEHLPEGASLPQQQQQQQQQQQAISQKQQERWQGSGGRSRGGGLLLPRKGLVLERQASSAAAASR